tara:strand:- start:104 stop:223 length:120 start_codon:yes stop_codon:yes gene_type:complete
MNKAVFQKMLRTLKIKSRYLRYDEEEKYKKKKAKKTKKS